jgi:hypothetical protein
MTVTITIAPVRKSIRVNANQTPAFEVFTSGLGRRWPRKATIAKVPMKAAVLEPRLGGRWYELAEDGGSANRRRSQQDTRRFGASQNAAALPLSAELSPGCRYRWNAILGRKGCGPRSPRRGAR